MTWPSPCSSCSLTRVREAEGQAPLRPGEELVSNGAATVCCGGAALAHRYGRHVVQQASIVSHMHRRCVGMQTPTRTAQGLTAAAASYVVQGPAAA